MEIALVIAIVLAAGIGIFLSYFRSLTGTKKSCSCGQTCSCGDSGCSCNEVFGTAQRCNRTLSE